MQAITLNGTVSLDENTLDKMNYIITSLVDGTQVSVTNILDTIFNSTNSIDKIIEIKGRIYDSNHLIYGFGKLKICIDGIRDQYKIKGYFCGDFPIERQLFELIGKNIEITICDYTDSISEFIDDINHTTEDMPDDTNTKTA